MRAGVGPHERRGMLRARLRRKRGPAVKDERAPVSVMHVEVDDRDTLRAHRLRGPRGDCDVVEDAEPHRPGDARVVAGRTHQREPVRRSRFDCRSGGKECGFIRCFGRRRIRVEPRLRRDAANVRDVAGAMTAQDLLLGGGTAFGPLERR
jgi:hypothetical protein